MWKETAVESFEVHPQHLRGAEVSNFRPERAALYTYLRYTTRGSHSNKCICVPISAEFRFVKHKHTNKNSSRKVKNIS
jgi:hypothetical protein